MKPPIPCFCLGVLLFLTAAASEAAPSVGLRVTLPDAGTYAYWVQSKSGTLEKMPVTVTGKAEVTLADGEGTLYVLDKHTGNIAAEALSGTPVTLTTTDFHSLTPSAVVSPAPPAPPAAAPAAPAPPEANGVARLFTLVFGLVVAAGVGWVLLRLVQSRGQPLITAARRLGIEVPDPSDLKDTEDAAPVYTPPTPRAPDKIPDEAGVVPPPPAAPVRRASVAGNLETPQIVATQGVAAGSTFLVPVGEIVIGRDGDNAIVLAEDTVSRRHARLVRDDAGGISIADAGSANGVYVNGSRVTQAALFGGDQIQIGDNHFRLET